MEAIAGDRIVVEGERVGQAAREGIVEEVLSGTPLRLRVRWDDGHVSILAPEAGAARVQRRKKARAGARAR
jgi:uncharacterized protein DUF1918